MTAATLRLERVTKSLAHRLVLSNVSFGCPAGAITALLGPNGAGKTTTVAVATGLRRPDSGRATVDGLDVGTKLTRQQVSVVPQEIGFPDAVTVRRCLDFVAAQRTAEALGPERGQLCERLGITELLPRRAGGLSGGERRKLAVALGLIRAPSVVILDEATTNLDEHSRAITWELIEEYAARGGTALVTSHILADIESHADRVVALYGGEVVLQGTLEQIRARLGGSQVSVTLPARLHDAARRQVALHRLGDAAGAPDGAVVWRTREPFALVQCLADFAAQATDLVVRPIPLSDLLDSINTYRDAETVRTAAGEGPT
jgi:ABC-2 type transport system ATP-binding protein